MPQGPFLALITPIGDAGGGGGGGGGGQPVYPSHPISLPGDPGFGQIPGFTPGTPPPRPHPQPPLGIWGGGNVPFPTPPIYIPITPPDLGYWGPNDPRPSPPIYIPVQPGGGDGGLGIWGGGNVPFPTPPIYIPLPPPVGGLPPAEIVAKIKETIEFWTGNLPENPDETPTPTK